MVSVSPAPTARAKKLRQPRTPSIAFKSLSTVRLTKHENLFKNTPFYTPNMPVTYCFQYYSLFFFRYYDLTTREIAEAYHMMNAALCASQSC